ncbi:MAG: NAD-dependent epimerase/dehydratase family protein [Flavobacteriaceae bacterium]|nr:NAD-dependent epimerase/dehydratase family protein [Flavobacteriaceae bacterium]
MKFVIICKEKKVKGPVNIQGRITDKGIVFFEMNMRFTGITGNRAQLGFNEVDFLVDNFLGLQGKLNGYAKNKLGVWQVACTTISRIKIKEKAKNTLTVLGAGGNIGSFFIHELIKENNFHCINMICRESSYHKYQSMFLFDGINITKDTDQIAQSVYSQSDVLVNFVGALAHKPDKEKYDAIIFQYEQLQKIIKANIPLVINVSTQSVYDQTLDLEKDENAEIMINNLYAFQKYLTENFYKSINFFSPSTKVVSLRFSRVIGTYFTNEKPKGFFANVIDAVINDENIEIPNPENKINLIDIRDVISAILFIINKTNWESLPKILNVGGTNLSIKQYCDHVIETLGLLSKKHFINFADNSDVKISSMIDSSLFKKFNWSPEFTIEETIKHIEAGINKELTL